jgi:hypothetical protein
VFMLEESKFNTSFSDYNLRMSEMSLTRKTLPYQKDLNQKVSIWKVIKDSIGKDLTKIPMPVEFNEPLSMLQKTAEIMEYSHLLTRATTISDPVLRMIYVAVFNVAQYKCTKNRLTKPFNPILGETYELVTPEFKFVAEQVSHHPPISACHASGANKEFELWMNTRLKTNFWGSCLEVVMIGLAHISIPCFDEIYTIQRPNTQVYNLVFGEMYLEHAGEMVVKQFTKNEINTLSLKFLKSGWG